MARRYFNERPGRAQARRATLVAATILTLAIAALVPARARGEDSAAPAITDFFSFFRRTDPAPIDPRRIPDTLPEKDSPWGPLQIVVYKGQRKLSLYRYGSLERDYSVVLGFNPVGRKRFAFDARTPEGKYHIVEKRPHERWQYFLAIDYPNEHDRVTYASEVEAGKIPDEDGMPFGIGSALGIHGNDRPQDQAAGTDWTKGCVAMGETDIAELYAIVEVGTPIWLVE